MRAIKKKKKLKCNISGQGVSKWAQVGLDGLSVPKCA